MFATSLFAVFVTARALLLGCGVISLSPWLPLAFLWQDVLFVLGFALLERFSPRRLIAVVYLPLVVYVAVNVPVACVLSTPLTWPMLQATRGTLADSILYYVTPLNLFRLGAVLAVGLLLPVWLRSRWPRLRRRLQVGAAVLGPLALLGPLVTRQLDTLGLHRNIFVVLARSVFPRIAPVDLDGDWRASPFGSPQSDDLSQLRSIAAGRNVVIIHLESTAAGYLRPYGAAEDPMPNLTALARRSLLFENA